MGASDIDPGILTSVDRHSMAEIAVIALLNKDEFAQARTVVADLNVYSDYREWLESREGFQMGLAMAGVEVKMVPVVLPQFLAWRRLTGAPPTERALNAFASAIFHLRTPPKPMALATIREQGFEARSRNVAAPSADSDYPEWLRRRKAIRLEAVMLGRHVEELPILGGDFGAGSVCVSQFCEASIDSYAQLALEYLADDFGGQES